MKKGFISMTVIYSIIIVFLVLMTSLLGMYSFRNTSINNQSNIVKEELNTNLNYYSFRTKILIDNSTKSVRNDFNSIFVANSTGTIYSTTADENNDGLIHQVYYYAGNTTNNWVKFGKTSDAKDIYWRIIRTNENGGIRLLYSGTLPSGTALNSGTSTSVAYISQRAFNSDISNPKYVGYKYQTTVENDTNSTIKETIDTWYKNNLLTSYGSYLDKQAIYCNDRTIGTFDIEAPNTYYGATSRLGGLRWIEFGYVRPSVVSPSYGCRNLSDRFSASSTGGGNGLLLNTDSNKSPIALMSADEVSYAGGLTGANLTSPYAWFYLNNKNASATSDKTWWTMSPFVFRIADSVARVFNVQGTSSAGFLGGNRVMYEYVARPVISLKPCVKIKGNGSTGSPYEIISFGDLDPCIESFE